MQIVLPIAAYDISVMAAAKYFAVRSAWFELTKPTPDVLRPWWHVVAPFTRIWTPCSWLRMLQRLLRPQLSFLLRRIVPWRIPSLSRRSSWFWRISLSPLCRPRWGWWLSAHRQRSPSSPWRCSRPVRSSSSRSQHRGKGGQLGRPLLLDQGGEWKEPNQDCRVPWMCRRWGKRLESSICPWGL